jgi:F0F1-type ATP synthase assembly protein I
MPSSEKNDGSQSWLRHGSKGFELAAAVAGFMLVGRWIGGYYGNARLGIVIGAVLGIVGGMYNLVRASLAEQARLRTKQDRLKE